MTSFKHSKLEAAGKNEASPEEAPAPNPQVESDSESSGDIFFIKEIDVVPAESFLTMRC